MVRGMLQPHRDGITVVLGDFNEWAPIAHTVRRLDALLGRSRAVRSFPSRLPVLALDRIWVRPRGALASLHAHRSRRAGAASDHLPVVGVVKLSR
jgi:endonuclease/exonuclease/phosphatase family metal-dependent hydrolase